jgi:predicted dehydrogenase
MLPALRDARGSELLAIAAREPERAHKLAGRHGVRRVHTDYAALLDDPDVDAVYLPLPNSLHLEWTLRALAAGKHVLCEKPLALNALEAEEMAEAAVAAGRLLMEAAMYRFNPRTRELAESIAGAEIRHLSAAFGFSLASAGNYRLRPELGGGALLDIGFYVADVARWLLGEPDRVEAIMRYEGVDMSCSALLGFPGGGQAALHASFESPEFQELVVICADRVVRLERPFTASPDLLEPYRLMVEAFSGAALAGAPAPHSPASSISTMRLLDRIRDAAD